LRRKYGTGETGDFMQLGIIGLGRMGANIGRRLMKAGHSIVGFDASANAVKAYLVSLGIAADKIKVKAEGGKIPLYPEASTLASYNDRVEVEFVKN